MINKTSRQILIFHIFLKCEVIEIKDIKDCVKVSDKTITRDIEELTNAGLINIKYSKREKGYVHIDDEDHCPFLKPVFSDNKAKNMHLEKLIRLATIMQELYGHEEQPYYEDCSKNQITCSSWYKTQFPSLSTRTMQRDFEVLNKIGYEIKYDRYEKYYWINFPEGIEDIKSRIDYKSRHKP